MLDWIRWPVNPAFLILAVVIVIEGILVMRFAKKGKLWKFAVTVVATVTILFLIGILVHVTGLME